MGALSSAGSSSWPMELPPRSGFLSPFGAGAQMVSMVLLCCIAGMGTAVSATSLGGACKEPLTLEGLSLAPGSVPGHLLHHPPAEPATCYKYSSPALTASIDNTPHFGTTRANIPGAVSERVRERTSESGNETHGSESGLTVGKMIKRLGVGRWGAVYEADVIGIGRAAVKLLGDDMIEMEGDIELSYKDFRTEAELQKRCNHPNVVRVYGVAPYPFWGNQSSSSHGRPDGSMVMEVVKNAQGLKDFIEDIGGDPRTGLPRDFRVSCALDIARALEHVHSRGVIHFDVKPENVLVDGKGSCKLGDFGVAWDPRSPPIRYKGRGTIAYMAPELMLSGKPANTKVDVFSFGLMMWSMLTSEEPHDGKEYDAIKEIVQNKERPQIDPNWARREPDWHELMTQCWRQPPHARPSFSWIVKVLERML